MSTIALIPARSGSRGIPGKNFRELGGRALWKLAVDCARAADIPEVIVSSDAFTCVSGISRGYVFQHNGERYVDVTTDTPDWHVTQLPRPPALAQDNTPMIDVVKHALEQIPGQPDDIWLLLQPTQVFREPKHIQQAIALLRETQADSVVSVVELPKTHSMYLTCMIDYAGRLEPSMHNEGYRWWNDMIPTSRQQVDPTYIRDGTVYCFWRQTVSAHGTIYGREVRPLIIPPEESCSLDTEADWAEVERRWKAKYATA